MVSDSAEVILSIGARLILFIVAKGCGTLKLLSPIGCSWALWHLEVKLQRKRLTDPALSWADRCEGPSMC